MMLHKEEFKVEDWQAVVVGKVCEVGYCDGEACGKPAFYGRIKPTATTTNYMCREHYRELVGSSPTPTRKDMFKQRYVQELVEELVKHIDALDAEMHRHVDEGKKVAHGMVLGYELARAGSLARHIRTLVGGSRE